LVNEDPQLHVVWEIKWQKDYPNSLPPVPAPLSLPQKDYPNSQRSKTLEKTNFRNLFFLMFFERGVCVICGLHPPTHSSTHSLRSWINPLVLYPIPDPLCCTLSPKLRAPSAPCTLYPVPSPLCCTLSQKFPHPRVDNPPSRPPWSMKTHSYMLFWKNNKIVVQLIYDVYA